MPPSKQQSVSDMFRDETGRVSVTWTMAEAKTPVEQARAHIREIVVITVRAVVTLAAFGLVYGLSSLFLKHGNAEQAEKVVIAALGIVGGFGLGEVGRKVAAKD